VNLILETDRLILRPLAADDLDIAITLWTDPEVTRYVARRPFPKDEMSQKMPIWIRRCAGGAVGIWCVIRKDTGEKLGSAVLLPLPVDVDDTDWSLVQGDTLPDGEIEIGYVYKREAWGHGYATEACTRLLQFAFEASSITDIVAVTDPENHASGHVLTKCGMQPVGMIHSYTEDLPGYRLSADQWRAQQSQTVSG